MGIIDLEKWGKLVGFAPQSLREIASDIAILERCGLTDDEIVIVVKGIVSLSAATDIGISSGLRAVTGLIHSSRPLKWEFVDNTPTE